jgi:hypothetical protein
MNNKTYERTTFTSFPYGDNTYVYLSCPPEGSTPYGKTRNPKPIFPIWGQITFPVLFLWFPVLKELVKLVVFNSYGIGELGAQGSMASPHGFGF